MSTLQQFLNQNPVDNLTDEVAISDRFKDEEGNLLKFKIKAMNGSQHAAYREKAMTINAKKKDVKFNASEFLTQIVLNHTVDPNFKDADSIQEMGCTSPEQYLHKVLLPGEIDKLAQRIQDLSGFKEMEELVEEAKN